MTTDKMMRVFFLVNQFLTYKNDLAVQLFRMNYTEV